jgi:hypothetical protein
MAARRGGVPARVGPSGWAWKLLGNELNPTGGSIWVKGRPRRELSVRLDSAAMVAAVRGLCTRETLLCLL